MSETGNIYKDFNAVYNMVKKKKSRMTTLDFETAFKYPFNRPKGMLNVLWLLLPIFGWFALVGYKIRIIKEFSSGKFKQLPIVKFGDDFVLGLFMFLKAIPFMLVFGMFLGVIYSISPVLKNFVEISFGLLVIPMLSINFMNKQTVASFFEFEVIAPVFNNVGDYLIAVLKEIAMAIAFLLMWIILVGVPAGLFTKNIFLADFYKRNVKKK